MRAQCIIISSKVEIENYENGENFKYYLYILYNHELFRNWVNYIGNLGIRLVQNPSQNKLPKTTETESNKKYKQKIYRKR